MSQFLILAEDYTDKDALTRRLTIRETHLKRMREEKKAGRFILGGAKFNDDGNMYGSMLIVNLEDEDAVKDWVYVDPYFTSKVWKHIHIYPFRIADV
jgi:uncharacterized protein YciI